MSEIINETINQLNKPTQNNVFSIEDDPVTVLEKINQVERYLKQIDTHVDTSINTANEALEKANNAFEANGTLVKINGENQLTWSADFAESERQKSKNLFDINKSVETTINCIYKTTSTLSTITATKTNANEVTISRIALKLSNLTIGKTYTISIGGITLSGSASGESSELTKLFLGDNDNADTANYGFLSNDNKSLTITATGTDLYIKKYLSYGIGESINTISNIQIEEGSVATDFQPYNGAIVHKSEVEPILIYDIDTKNTIGGTAYTTGINYGTTINNDFTPYKKVKVYAYRQQNGPFTYEINLEQKDIGQNVYSGSGICYSYQESDNYFAYSSASISENKQQLRIIKCGYTTDFFTTPTLSTTCYIYRLEAYK